MRRGVYRTSSWASRDCVLCTWFICGRRALYLWLFPTHMGPAGRRSYRKYYGYVDSWFITRTFVYTVPRPVQQNTHESKKAKVHVYR